MPSQNSNNIREQYNEFHKLIANELDISVNAVGYLRGMTGILKSREKVFYDLQARIHRPYKRRKHSVKYYEDISNVLLILTDDEWEKLNRPLTEKV